MNLSSEIVVLVSGEAKSEMVAEVLRQRDAEAPALPAAMVRPRDRLHWIMDEAAARYLQTDRRS
jgi:6-phosphogluconolactonase/glucosamine-6-phosphate isomerase/deaminase